MKIFKKKSLLISIVAGLLFALFMIPSIRANAEEAPIRDRSKVQLYYNETQFDNYAGSDNHIYIKVSKELKNVRVYVESKSAENNNELNTSYVDFFKILDDDYYIYAVELCGRSYFDYTIKAYSDQGNYIDDDNGKPYTLATTLGAANICAVRDHYFDLNKFEIKAVVKNLAYEKKVKVHYTLDGWKTSKEADLQYISTAKDGSTDLWRTLIDIPTDNYHDFEYALSYTVNGQTYWDNNFGRNYNSSFRDQD